MWTSVVMGREGEGTEGPEVALEIRTLVIPPPPFPPISGFRGWRRYCLHTGDPRVCATGGLVE